MKSSASAAESAACGSIWPRSSSASSAAAALAEREAKDGRRAKPLSPASLEDAAKDEEGHASKDVDGVCASKVDEGPASCDGGCDSNERGCDSDDGYCASRSAGAWPFVPTGSCSRASKCGSAENSCSRVPSSPYSCSAAPPRASVSCACAAASCPCVSAPKFSRDGRSRRARAC